MRLLSDRQDPVQLYPLKLKNILRHELLTIVNCVVKGITLKHSDDQISKLL
jgi:hypothetical protein